MGDLSPNSYAARTGRSANIGVIGVAVFRERRPERTAATASPAPAPPSENRAESLLQSEAGLAAKSAEATRAPATVNAPSALAHLGTGHGAREVSYVQFVDFIRATTEPSEIVRIRYDSRENLVALGIIPRSAPLAGDPNPFPDSPAMHFVPDPPACNSWQPRQCVHD